MKRATITLTYDSDRDLFQVVGLAIEQLKNGLERGKIHRNGITAEYEQEIVVDWEKLETRIENNVMYIKSKI